MLEFCFYLVFFIGDDQNLRADILFWEQSTSISFLGDALLFRNDAYLPKQNDAYLPKQTTKSIH